MHQPATAGDPDAGDCFTDCKLSPKVENIGSIRHVSALQSGSRKIDKGMRGWRGGIQVARGTFPGGLLAL